MHANGTRDTHRRIHGDIFSIIQMGRGIKTRLFARGFSASGCVGPRAGRTQLGVAV